MHSSEHFQCDREPKKLDLSMEISASLVCVCLLVLLSTLVTKSVGSKDVVQAERDTERDIVHIQQRPLMERGSAQVSD